jgi:hypothetical protein
MSMGASSGANQQDGDLEHEPVIQQAREPHLRWLSGSPATNVGAEVYCREAASFKVHCATLTYMWAIKPPEKLRCC